jgi:hypothetical protein
MLGKIMTAAAGTLMKKRNIPEISTIESSPLMSDPVIIDGISNAPRPISYGHG